MAHLPKITGTAVLLLLGASLAGTAGAQARIFSYDEPGPRPAHQYGLLNGNNLSLYLNDRGDLGAPYRPGFATKPLGKLDGNGQPFVNDDGSLTLVSGGANAGTTQGGTYAALFSRTPTAGAATIGDSVKAKHEYVTAVGGNVTEGYSVRYNNTWLKASDLVLDPAKIPGQQFFVSGDSATGALSATSNLFAQKSGSKGLSVSQQISFQQNGVPANWAQFKVTFTNNDTVAATGIRYARAIDPNQGSTPITSQAFGAQSAPSDAFAIDSVTAGDVERHLGLGVLEGDPNSVGSILLATTTLGENTLLNNPTNQINSNGFIRLNDTAGNVSFFNSAGNQVGSPAFGNAGVANAALMLISPEFSLAPGASTSYTFYYFFDPLTPSDVPEPGAIALLVGVGVSGLLAFRRKK